MLLKDAVLHPLTAFNPAGVSIPCIRAFRASLSQLLGNLTVADAITGVMMPLTHAPSSSLASALAKRNACDESGAPLSAPATAYIVYSDTITLDELFDAVEVRTFSLTLLNHPTSASTPSRHSIVSYASPYSGAGIRCETGVVG